MSIESRVLEVLLRGIRRWGAAWMLALFGLAVFGAGALVSDARAQEATHCPAATAAREEAKALLRAGSFPAAIERLEAAVREQGQCELRPKTEWEPDEIRAWYWLRSDLALAYRKAGREVACLRLLSSLINNPGSRSDVLTFLSSDEPVVKALQHNTQACEKARMAKMRAFRAEPCPFAVEEGARAAVKVSAAPRGGAECLALVDEPKAAVEASGAQADDVPACPKLAIASLGKRKPLMVMAPTGAARPEAAEDPLSNPSLCCNFRQISVAEQNDGRRLVRVLGQGRDCFGGTADQTTDVIYEWTGDSLTLVENASIDWH